MIIFEKKKELYQKDKESYENKVDELKAQKDSFDEWRTKIMWNREQLDLGREEVSHDMTKYNVKKEALAKTRQDLDFEKSVL